MYLATYFRVFYRFKYKALSYEEKATITIQQ